jgi:hypothetical protein
MRSSAIAPQRAVIRFSSPSVQVSRKTLEVLASALEEVRLFYGLSSLQAVARDETRRLLRGENVAMTLTSSDHVLMLMQVKLFGGLI